MDDVYDFCVVGAGMVGSAAAKWLSMMKHDAKVCLIGPEEPTEEEWKSEKRQIFSSYYDKGRITTDMDEDYIWATLAHRSIHRYRDIEKQSGLNIFSEVGLLWFSGQIDSIVQTAQEMGTTSFNMTCPADLRKKFPFLHLKDDLNCLYNYKNAGYICPRSLVAAQQKIARSHGCDIISEVVVAVQEAKLAGGVDGEVHKILCENGRELRARRVLLCTGAFSNFHRLLPGDKQIDFFPRKTIVVKAEVSEDYARRLADMPAIKSRPPGESVYILPPIKYPDGKYYVKIGRNSRGSVLQSLEEVSDWFRSCGEQDEWKDQGLDIFKSFLKDLNPLSVSTSCCVSSHTPTDRPYCDMITPRLGALMGMTGQGAKSSDEIGRMGALMISRGSWDYDLPADIFKLRYKYSSRL